MIGTTEQPTLERTLEAIGKETGLTAKILQWEPHFDWHTALHPDALVEIDGTETTEQFAAEIKTIPRLETLHHCALSGPVKQNRHFCLWLLTSPQTWRNVAVTSTFTLRTWRATSTFAHPAFILYVTGRHRPNELITTQPGRIGNPAGLRVIFALLCEPDLLNTTYRKIAATAGVALGTIGAIFKDLENRKYITQPYGTARAHRRFLDMQRLVQEWVTLYPTILKPKLNTRKFRAADPNWKEGLNLQPYHAYWGGEMAANRMLHHLVPQTATIYAKETPKRLIAEYKLRADPNGDVEFLDTFWNDDLPLVGDLVPPLLAYADLTATADGRNLEAAKMIYDKYIEPAFRNPT